MSALESLRKASPARAALIEVLHWARAAEAEARTTAFEIYATKPGRVPHHEGRAEAYADAVRELERATARIAQPSIAEIKRRVHEEHESAVRPLDIAEDLRAPEPGSFEGAEIERTTVPPGLYETSGLSNPDDPLTLATIRGAMVILADGSMVKPGETPIGRAAVREALALLRSSLFGTLPGASTSAAIGGPTVAAALDRIAERFK